MRRAEITATAIVWDMTMIILREKILDSLYKALH